MPGSPEDARGQEELSARTSGAESDTPSPPLIQTTNNSPSAPQQYIAQQFIQQSAAHNFDKLTPEVQAKMISAMEAMDQRGFTWAQHNSDKEHAFKHAELADSGSARKQILTVATLVVGAILIAGVIISIMFIRASQYQLANTIMTAGISALGGFLGGLGVSSIFKSNPAIRSE